MEDDGLRRLAAAVLRQAVEEAHGAPRASVAPSRRKPLRAEALAFLRPEDSDLQFWCECIDLDPVEFCEAARRNGHVLIAQHRERPREKEAAWS